MISCLNLYLLMTWQSHPDFLLLDLIDHVGKVIAGNKACRQTGRRDG